jgi:hypothetical protein
MYGYETWSLTFREEQRLRVSENRVLRIFGPQNDEVVGERRKAHKELRDLYSSPSMIRMIKSRRVRWAGHVARMGKGNAHRLLVESQRERGHLEEQDLGEWIILRWIFERYDGLYRLDWSGSG